MVKLLTKLFPSQTHTKVDFRVELFLKVFRVVLSKVGPATSKMIDDESLI